MNVLKEPFLVLPYLYEVSATIELREFLGGDLENYNHIVIGST
jgi:hypothetical protein